MQSRTRQAVHEVRHYSKGGSLSPHNSSTRQTKVKFADKTAGNVNTSDGGLRQTMKKQVEESLKEDTGVASQSEKYEYSSKLREKKNYVYYVSGVGYVTKEEEEKPKPVVKKEEETYIERKHIIDNYQYHETKNIKKANKTSNVFHKRLAQPFEVTEQIKTTKKIPEFDDENEVYEVPVKKNIQIVNQKKYNVNPNLNRRILTPNTNLRNRPKPESTEEYYEMREGYTNGNEQIYDDAPSNEYYYYQERNENQNGKKNFSVYESRSNAAKNKRGGQTTVFHKRGKNSYDYQPNNASFNGPITRNQVVSTTSHRRGYVVSPYQTKNLRK